MKYLLDTHAIIWFFEDSEKLSKTAANIIKDSEASKYISIASLWEFTIKYDSGKLLFEGGLSRLWEMITQNGFIILPITQPHLASLTGLPFIHRDPFDRLLVAVAKAEGMALLTADENIHRYDISSAW